MKLIKHRTNTLEALRDLPAGWGAEMDLRSFGSRLVVAHDAFTDGVDFSVYLEHWRERATSEWLVINAKEDGLETEALRFLEQNAITQYFFIDLPLPALIRLAIRKSHSQAAVRTSEYEPLAATQPFIGRVQWVWVDCFSGKAPLAETLQVLRRSFQVCLVSPELHGYPRESLRDFLPLAPQVDAVCTQHPDWWL